MRKHQAIGRAHLVAVLVLDEPGPAGLQHRRPHGRRRHWTTALAHNHDGDWALGAATVRECLGTVYADWGRQSEAVEHFTASLELYRAAGFRPGEIRTLSNLAEVEIQLGRVASARRHTQAALTLAQDHGQVDVQDLALIAL